MCNGRRSAAQRCPGIVAFALLLLVAPGSKVRAQEGPYALLPEHVGCVVDEATLTAVAESDFLRSKFAHMRAGGAPPPRSNQFINGRFTFVEFINPRIAEALGVQVGDCMIALSSERIGWLEVLRDDLRERYPKADVDFRLRELRRGPDVVPWYYMLDVGFESGIGGLGLWFKEFHPDFKHRMAPAYSEAGDISRERSAPEVAFHPDKYFRDVTSVTVAVPPERRVQLEELLRVAGFLQMPAPDLTVWSSDDFRVEIAPASGEDEYALRTVQLSLGRVFTEPTRSFDLGSVTLSFPNDTTAALDFSRRN